MADDVHEEAAALASVEKMLDKYDEDQQTLTKEFLEGRGGVEEKKETPPEQPVEEKAETTEEKPPEHYEFEWNGAKYQVPPELKELHDGYLRQQDYTKKTQEAASLKQSVEAMMQQAKAAEALRQAALPQKEQLAALRAASKHYQSMDWNQLATDNPVEAQKQFMAHSQIKDSISRLEQEIKTEEGKAMQSLQQAHAKFLEEGNKALSKDIKDWSPEKAQKLNKFAQDAYGFTPRETSEVVDARVVKMMHDAYEWRQLQASKPQVQNKAVQVSKTLKPNASDQSNPGLEAANYKKALNAAKTDAEKARVIQQRIESRIV